jgi:hypothetical protein
LSGPFLNFFIYLFLTKALLSGIGLNEGLSVSRGGLQSSLHNKAANFYFKKIYAISLIRVAQLTIFRGSSIFYGFLPTVNIVTLLSIVDCPCLCGIQTF